MRQRSPNPLIPLPDPRRKKQLTATRTKQSALVDEEVFRDRVRLLLGAAKKAGFSSEQTKKIRVRPREPADIEVLIESLREFARLAGST